MPSLRASLLRLPRLALLPFLVAAALAASTARPGATSTALDRYVAQPDPSFAWSKAAEARSDGVTSYTLDLVSQSWLKPGEVNRTAWRHWLVIVKPDNLAHDTALLFISGGANRPGEPAKASREYLEIARATRSVVVELRMVPNQTLVFDGDGKERTEDDLIAYTWAKYLKTGDDRWPARLPMTKAAVRAMDATTAFLASDAGGHAKVENFVVAGASKRGWTTWTAGIVDRRVVALCPLVIDVLNVEQSFRHHHAAYGFFAPSVRDYVHHGIVNWVGTPESRALYAIEDPYSYRDRLTMPKLLINACGDQFFLPDSSQFYFAELPGVKYLRYIPNTDHSLRNSDAPRTLLAWHHAILNRTPLPQFSWRHEPDGSVVVDTRTAPREVKFWQAHNPRARDFRLESLGPAWRSSAVTGRDGTFSARPEAHDAGWTAYFLEMTFELTPGLPLTLTTDVTVTPRNLPFAPFQAATPKGFLSQ